MNGIIYKYKQARVCPADTDLDLFIPKYDHPSRNHNCSLKLFVIGFYTLPVNILQQIQLII
ncbi:hypothetical protein M2105_005722 [Paenibacillus sp. PastF-1]|nr:hypothetical protein [Paenibacillus sp. PastF-2]MDF9857824.1 hypothetical protein [Paenibacillus sp. PastF-1]MDH6510502.1 hypothetical protein [Paenibacillus sp. PastM-3]